VIYLLVSQRLIKDSYQEDQVLIVGKKISKQKSNYLGLKYEWKMLWRNSRFRTIYFVQNFVLVGNIIIQSIVISGHFSSESFLILTIALNAGIFFSSFSYGQFFCTSESTFFDKYLTLPTNFAKTIKDKYLLMSILTLITVFLMLCTSLIEPGIWKVIIASYFFNIGISNYLIIYRGTFNKTRFEINSSTWFNYQGVKFKFYWADLYLLISILFFSLTCVLFKKIESPDTGLLLLGFLGIVSVGFRGEWVKFILKGLSNRKHSMSSGFRNHFT
jgi:hypothetical protein